MIGALRLLVSITNTVYSICTTHIVNMSNEVNFVNKYVNIVNNDYKHIG